MAQVLITTDTLQAISDAVRDFAGTDEGYYPSEIPDAIKAAACKYYTKEEMDAILQERTDELNVLLEREYAHSAITDETIDSIIAKYNEG